MGRLDKIDLTNKPEPYRLLIYGIEGVGKSKFGAESEKPIFISVEGGTSHLRTRDMGKVPVMPGVNSFKDIKDSVLELITEKHDFKTLVLDSLDWIESFAHKEIIGDSTKDIIRVNGGYGAGYRESQSMHVGLKDLIERLRVERQMNIILTAHYEIKPVKNPEAIADYDGFRIKLHEYVSSLWREYVDCTFYAKFETLVAAPKDGEKVIVTGQGKRLMYTQARPHFQAKNRYNLPFEMPVDFRAFEKGYKDFHSALFVSAEQLLIDLNQLAEKMPKDEAEKMLNAAREANGNVATLNKILNYTKSKLSK